MKNLIVILLVSKFSLDALTSLENWECWMHATVILGTAGVKLMVYFNFGFKYSLVRFFSLVHQVLTYHNNLPFYLDRHHSLWKDRVWKQLNSWQSVYFRQNSGSLGHFQDSVKNLETKHMLASIWLDLLSEAENNTNKSYNKMLNYVREKKDNLWKCLQLTWYKDRLWDIWRNAKKLKS